MTKEELAAAKVPEALHENPLLKEVKDLATLAQVAVDVKSYQGTSIRIPSENASEADHKEFREKLKAKVPSLVEVPDDPEQFALVEETLFEKLGKPKEAKGYPALKDAKIELPEGVEVNEDELRGYAAKLGMTKKQYATFAKQVVEERAEKARANSKAVQDLKKELGPAFDERLTAAAAAAQKLGYSAEKVEAIRKGLVSVEDAKAWINVAKSLGTEGAELNRDGGGSQRMTPEEARAQIEELYRNPILNDRSNPRHADLMQKLVQLTAIGYPD
jgi:hypothetical protein